MAVVSLADVKTLLQITGTEKDPLITLLIPKIEAFIRKECRVDFQDPWPDGLDLVASQMIGFQMSQMSGGGGSIGLQSESQGEYSYTRGSGGANGAYPDSIMKSLWQWKVTGVRFAQKAEVSRDRRNLTIGSLAEGNYVRGVEGVIIADS